MNATCKQREHMFATLAEQTERYNGITRPLICVCVRALTTCHKNRYVVALKRGCQALDRRAHFRGTKSAQNGIQRMARNFDDSFVTLHQNVIGAMLPSWRVVASMAEKCAVDGSPEQQRLVEEYRNAIEREIVDTCVDMVALLDTTLLPSSASAEASAFFFAFKGDCNRLVAEFCTVERAAAIQQAGDAYEHAWMVSQRGLPAIHPVRLGVALSYSTFEREIVGSQGSACRRTQLALDHVGAHVAVQHSQAAILLQMLRDNLALWTRT